jgi:hypothetical protein
MLLVMGPATWLAGPSSARQQVVSYVTLNSTSPSWTCMVLRVFGAFLLSHSLATFML